MPSIPDTLRKAPHAVVAHPIPRNPSGKIQKHLLRAELLR
jgi:acyl-coenzyme A synthetase/AMP-(fatty) acid ligase